MLLASGNSPTTEGMDFLEISPSPIASPTTMMTTESTVIVSPIPTPEPTKGWLNRTVIFWGIIIIILVALIWYWLKNRKK